MTTNLNRYFVFDGLAAVDGEFHSTRESLLGMVGYYSQPDYIILGFDTRQIATGSCQMLDVTGEIAAEWWENGGEVETFDNIQGGEKVCWLARRFYDDAVTAWENEGLEAETAADIWRDERLQGAA